jgi:cytochrome c1
MTETNQGGRKAPRPSKVARAIAKPLRRVGPPVPLDFSRLSFQELRELVSWLEWSNIPGTTRVDDVIRSGDREIRRQLGQ